MGKSKSGPFLIELLTVITVFAVCAAICVRLFTAAHLTARDSQDLSRAVNLARNAAEEFKATGGIRETAYFYDHSLTVRMKLADGPVPACVITVSRADGRQLFVLGGGGNG
jgi:hypothetical protein